MSNRVRTRTSGEFLGSVKRLLRYSSVALGRAIGVLERDVVDQTKGLVTTKDRITLELYDKLAEAEGLTLKDFLLKYKLGKPKKGA